jgi:guanyl-specific ribonuclease Sa
MAFADPYGLWNLGGALVGVAEAVNAVAPTVAIVAGVGALIFPPAAPVLGPLALGANVLTAGASAYLAYDTCTNGAKGACTGAVVTAAISAAGAIPGGRLLGGSGSFAAKYGRNIPFGPASEDAWTVLNRVDAKGAPLPGYKGGKTFLNHGSQGATRLPEGPTYREWDLSPNIKGVPRDARRLVTGSDGSAYYTTDHYLSFIQFR